MKIRWKGTPVVGAFHNDPNGIETGQVVDLDDVRYIKHEPAEPIDHDAAGAHI